MKSVTVTLIVLIVLGLGGLSLLAASGNKPTLMHSEPAHYTSEAIKENVTGTVKLAIVIEPDGTVGDIQVTKRLGYGLEQEAYRAVKRYTFIPPGKRIKGYRVEVKFSRLDVK